MERGEEASGRGRVPAQPRPAPPPRTRLGPAPARAEPSRVPSLPGLRRAAAPGSGLRLLRSGASVPEARESAAAALGTGARGAGVGGGPAAAMAGSQDMFDAIVMADDRWVGGWAGPPPEQVCSRPLGCGGHPGPGGTRCGSEGGWRGRARDASASPLLIGLSGERHVPSCSSRSASPVRGCLTHLLGLVTASLQGRSFLGWDGPLPSGRCPFFLFLSGRTYGSIHGQALKCVRRPPFPS